MVDPLSVPQPADGGGTRWLRVAEADGNRTRLTEMLGHNGFEDRAHHQTRYASVDSVGTARDTRFGPSPP
ncbi:MAG: hypothetical protein QOI06_282 [Nocardioidaceae bacterium]|jgi:hypothetical protein|nr:hypothetical protein [Nocardioidaceae bacterium]